MDDLGEQALIFMEIMIILIWEIYLTKFNYFPINKHTKLSQEIALL